MSEDRNQPDGAPRADGAEDAPVRVYAEGETLLGLYRVEAPPIESGGMGRVYRVHHTGWNVDLAMKQPRARRNMAAEERDDFIRESQAWIDLGLHPGIVSCYYVRFVDDALSIFSEWMDGGSLREWIADGRLYEGGQEESLKRILDISIQTARGLKYAHAHNLIHCDIKPANLLMTNAGDVKVADFGIAKSRGASAGGGGVSVYTEAYCSPEQQRGGMMTPQTDIWSWAVTVLEMFVGERLWQSGLTAGYGCDEYFDMTRVYLPDEMADLLRQCFKRDEGDRPRNFGEVEQALTNAYLYSTGEEYPRPEATSAADTADSLNNRALSYLDMGMPEEADAYWQQALLSSPAHAETLYNRALYRWRSGRYSDRQALGEMHRAEGARAGVYEAMLQLERGDAAAADACLSVLRDGAGGEDAARLHAVSAEMMEGGADGGLILEESTDGEGAFDRIYGDAEDRYLLATDRDHRVHLLDADTLAHTCAIPFDEKRDAVAAAFSASGQRFAAGSNEGKTISFMGERVREFETLLLRVWDLDTKKCIMEVEGHTERVLAVGFSADSGKLLTAAKDRTVKTWDIESGECCGKYAVDGELTTAAFSPDGTRALLGTENGEVRLLNVENGKETLLKESNKRVEFVGFCGDDKCLSVARDEGLTLWDERMRKPLLRVDAAKAEEAYMDPAGRYIAARSGKSLILYHAQSGRSLRTYRAEDGAYTAFLIKDGGKTLVAVQGDKLLAYSVPRFAYRAEYILCKVAPVGEVLAAKKTFDEMADNIRRSLENGAISEALGFLVKARSTPFFGGGKAYNDLSQDVRKYCVDDNVAAFYASSIWYAGGAPLDGRGFEGVAYLPDGNGLLCADARGDVRLARSEETSLRPLFRYDRDIREENRLAVSPNGARFLVQRGSVIVQADADAARVVCEMRGHSGSVTDFAYSPDGRWVLSCGEDRTIRLWEADAGRLVRTFREHTGAVCGVAFLPDADSFCSCSLDGTIRLWRRTSAHSFRTMGQGALTAVDCSPDGRYIVSGDRDGYVKLWDVQRGEMRWESAEHTARVSFVKFHPDGRMIVSIDKRDNILLWSVENGEVLRTAQSPVSVYSADISPRGDSMVLGCANELRMYRFDFVLRFPGFVDWDEGARPYLKRFLAQYPSWTETEFTRLITDLQAHGLGYLKPEGVRGMLERMRRA